jgi:hypothetical protein
MKRSHGSIKYELIYPLTNLEKSLWPIDYTKFCPNQTFDGGERNAPWNICSKPYMIPSNEVKKYKEGKFEVQLN